VACEWENKKREKWVLGQRLAVAAPSVVGQCSLHIADAVLMKPSSECISPISQIGAPSSAVPSWAGSIVAGLGRKQRLCIAVQSLCRVPASAHQQTTYTGSPSIRVWNHMPASWVTNRGFSSCLFCIEDFPSWEIWIPPVVVEPLAEVTRWIVRMPSPAVSTRENTFHWSGAGEAMKLQVL
jgi:hypothetical protein